jgi:hypothetical protein
LVSHNITVYKEFLLFDTYDIETTV